MGYDEGCEWDDDKSGIIEELYGFSLLDCAPIVNDPDLIPWGHSAYPNQLRKCGLVDNRLVTVAYEDVEDAYGSFVHIITAWPSTPTERKRYNG